MLHIIWSILIGFLIGLIARAVMGYHLDFIMTTALGIGGSFVGGLLAQVLSKPASGVKFHPAGLLMSVIGAILLLYAYTHFHG